MKDLTIIGAGPVGLFAIFQAGMLGIKSHVIDILPEVGGQCTAMYPEKYIYDIPAIGKITGGDLIKSLYDQASPFNPTYQLNSKVSTIEKLNDHLEIHINNGEIIKSKAVIIAAGGGAFTPNKPMAGNLSLYEDKYIFYNVKDKNRFQDKNILIAGGGDSALDWTNELKDIANKIYLVHRRNKFKGMNSIVEQIKDDHYKEKIEIIMPYQIQEFLGDNGILNGVDLKNSLNDEIKKLDIDYALLFFGLVSNYDDLKNFNVNLHDKRSVMINSTTCKTSVDRIYAIGDIAHYENKLQLILTGFAEAASACHQIYSILNDGQKPDTNYSTSKGISEIK